MHASKALPFYIEELSFFGTHACMCQNMFKAWYLVCFIFRVVKSQGGYFLPKLCNAKLARWLARKLFTPSTDSPILTAEIENKIFSFWFLCVERHKWGCFCVFLANFTRPWAPIQRANFLAQVFFGN